MSAVPARTPVTIPVVLPTVAMLVLPLIHVPVPVASDKVAVSPSHTVRVPLTLAGRGFTVTTVVMEHGPGNAVIVMVAVPAAIPVTTPETLSIVAIEVSPVLQTILAILADER